MKRKLMICVLCFLAAAVLLSGCSWGKKSPAAEDSRPSEQQQDPSDETPVSSGDGDTPIQVNPAPGGDTVPGQGDSSGSEDAGSEDAGSGNTGEEDASGGDAGSQITVNPDGSVDLPLLPLP